MALLPEKKMNTITSKKTYIGDADHKGRGVFAAQPIASCEIIEISPVLIIEGDLACSILYSSPLSDYVYDWTRDDVIDEDAEDVVAIGLGHTSLYNTDDNNDPNATFDINHHEKTITISALRDIRAGEEITISYGDEEDIRDSLTEICDALARLKLRVRNEIGIGKEIEDIEEIQFSLHQLTQDHFSKDNEDAPI